MLTTIWVVCGVAAWLMVIARTVFRAKKKPGVPGSAIVLLACLLTGPIALVIMIADWTYWMRFRNPPPAIFKPPNGICSTVGADETLTIDKILDAAEKIKRWSRDNKPAIVITSIQGVSILKINVPEGKANNYPFTGVPIIQCGTYIDAVHSAKKYTDDGYDVKVWWPDNAGGELKSYLQCRLEIAEIEAQLRN